MEGVGRKIGVETGIFVILDVKGCEKTVDSLLLVGFGLGLVIHVCIR